jgi:hypothetical protein
MSKPGIRPKGISDANRILKLLAERTGERRFIMEIFAR